MLSGKIGTRAAVHPALERMGPSERLRAEQELTRGYGAIMPARMGSAVASCFAALVSGTTTGGNR